MKTCPIQTVPQAVHLIQQDRITNLPYGTVFKKVRVLDMSSSTWPHVFKIPHIAQLPPLQSYNVCVKLPLNIFKPHTTKQIQAAESMVEYLKRFCEQFSILEDRYRTLMSQIEQEIRRQYTTMQDLVLPNKPESAKAK